MMYADWRSMVELARCGQKWTKVEEGLKLIKFPWTSFMDGRCGYYKWNNPENSNTNSQLENLTTSLSENACTWHAHMYAQTDEQVKNIMLPLANPWAIGDIKILKTVLQHFMSEVCGWPLLTEYPPTWSLASVAESASR